MSKVITGKKVAKGYVLLVMNEEKQHNNTFQYRGQADDYICLHVEDARGKNEAVLLLTSTEFSRCGKLELPETIVSTLVAGRLYGCVLAGRQKYMVKLYTSDGEAIVRTMSMINVNAWRERAKNHQASIPKKSKWADLFD